MYPFAVPNLPEFLGSLPGVSLVLLWTAVAVALGFGLSRLRLTRRLQAAPESSPAPAQPAADQGPDLPPAAIAEEKSSPRTRPYVRYAVRPSTSARAGLVLDHVVTDQLLALAGGVVGTSHDQSGELSDDSFALAAHDTGLVVAVADGLGSCEFAHAASDQAARAFVDALVGSMREPSQEGSEPCQAVEHLRRACHEASEAVTSTRLRRLVDSRALPSGHPYHVPRTREPATTLVGACVGSHPDGLCVSWISVGDSQIGSLGADGTTRWFTPRDAGNNIVNAVLPGGAGSATTGSAFLAAGERCVLATDGMADVLDELTADSSRLALALSKGRDALPVLLSLLEVEVPGAVDDRTCIVVGRRSG